MHTDLGGFRRIGFRIEEHFLKTKTISMGLGRRIRIGLLLNPNLNPILLDPCASVSLLKGTRTVRIHATSKEW